jgi:outer membrane protein OmpA-like peptidoglycan-associated protein
MRIVVLVAVLFLASCACPQKSASEPAVVEEPPPPPKRIVVTETVVEVIDYTRFAPNSAEIVAEEHVELDAIASTLVETPAITKVEVQGHADASETDPAGIAQARAEAVVAYLVAKGIAADRLVAKGYAADVTVSMGDAPDQASANRAVTYLVLERREPGASPSP